MSSAAEKLNQIDTLTHMGLEVVEDTINCLTVKMPKEGNSNHLGGIYAGAIFTLAEFPFGMMYVSRFDINDMFPVLGEMSIRYLAPAIGTLTVEVNVSDEEWAEIEYETKSKGKLKLVREVEVKDEQGNVNAVVKATYFSILAGK